MNAFWFRRDLRLEDNCALFQALKANDPVLPVFIFDSRILKSLPRADARVEFIHRTLEELHSAFEDQGSGLQVYHGDPVEIWPQILREFKLKAIYCNEDYEPYARERDARVQTAAEKAGARFESFKDQVIFAKDEVVKDSGDPYRVYTPYSRRWLARLTDADLKSYSANFKGLAQREANGPPSLKELGFKKSNIELPGKSVKKSVFAEYARKRDLMGVPATSRLGLHLRFGTISVRKLVRVVRPLSEVYLKELIWREFFMQILFHFPKSATASFNPRYDNIKWRDDEGEFERWKSGATGYPIVDAGMRELKQTGFMHNRARMITASFLTKHLLIDWRWGERYFAQTLLDFDLSANVGNWQWAAGSGCDAAPYFRVFNPYLQAKKFDADGAYVKKWVPEFGSPAYPEPMVDHEHARRRALKIYKEGLET